MAERTLTRMARKTQAGGLLAAIAALLIATLLITAPVIAASGARMVTTLVYELARRSEDGQPYYVMRFVKGKSDLIEVGEADEDCGRAVDDASAPGGRAGDRERASSRP